MAFVRPAITVAAKFTAPITNLNPSNISAVAQADETGSRLTGSSLNEPRVIGKLLNPLNQTELAGSATVAALMAPELPLLDVNFCGECLPLDKSDVADRWKHVFTLFRSHASDLGGLRQRAEDFFPIIEPIMEKYDIPDDFRYVPMAESALRPKAVSRAGAAGYWQLMPGTARALGLRVGGRTDERFNVHKATEAACRYLRNLYDQLGSWSLVAAAYNAGPGLLKNQLKRSNHRDYYRMNLPRETRFYLYRVLLYKEIMSRPDDYSSFLTPATQTAYLPPWQGGLLRAA